MSYDRKKNPINLGTHLSIKKMSSQDLLVENLGCYDIIGSASYQAEAKCKVICNTIKTNLCATRPGALWTDFQPCTQAPKKKRTEIIKPPRRADAQGIVGRKENSNTRLAFLITPCAPLASSHFIVSLLLFSYL